MYVQVMLKSDNIVRDQGYDEHFVSASFDAVPCDNFLSKTV